MLIVLGTDGLLSKVDVAGLKVDMGDTWCASLVHWVLSRVSCRWYFYSSSFSTIAPQGDALQRGTQGVRKCCIAVHSTGV